jgi:hypothetical protein
MAKAQPTGTARYERIGAGQWRDKVTGKTVRSEQNPGKGKAATPEKKTTEKTTTTEAKGTKSSGDVATEAGKGTADSTTASEGEVKAASAISAGKKFATEALPDGYAGRITDPHLTSKIADPAKVERIKFEQDSQSIGQLENAYEQAKAGNPYYADLMGRHMAGLEGFTGAEYQALREQGNRQIDINSQTAMRTMQKAQGKNAVSGDAAAAQAQKLAMDTSRLKQQNESDLMASGAKERTTRLVAAGDFANQGFDIQQKAIQAALKNKTDFTSNQQLMSQNADIANQRASSSDITNQLEADKTNATIGMDNNAWLRNMDVINTGKQETEAVNRFNAAMGYAGVTSSYDSQIFQDETTKKAIELAQRGLRP